MQPASWDTNNDGVYGDRTGATASYILTSSGGTYPLGLEVIDGMGHDMPLPLLPRIAEGIVANAARSTS